MIHNFVHISYSLTPIHGTPISSITTRELTLHQANLNPSKIQEYYILQATSIVNQPILRRPSSTKLNPTRDTLMKIEGLQYFINKSPIIV